MTGTTTHGQTCGGKRSKEHRAWTDMRLRCYNENRNSYHNYGGRGIEVCARWLNSFENFLEDVGFAPSNEYSIDRIDNNRNYEPGNVKWSTKKEQNKNTRANILIRFNEESMILKDWAEKLSIKYTTLYCRLFSYGWSVKEAFTTPVEVYKNRGKKESKT